MFLIFVFFLVVSTRAKFDIGLGPEYGAGFATFACPSMGQIQMNMSDLPNNTKMLEFVEACESDVILLNLHMHIVFSSEELHSRMKANATQMTDESLQPSEKLHYSEKELNMFVIGCCAGLTVSYMVLKHNLK